MRRPYAAALLGAAAVVWSALPFEGTGGGGPVLVIVAAACVFAGALRLGAWGAARAQRASWAARFGSPGTLFQRAGWEILAIVAVVALEVLHHSRPWHTGLLALIVTCYVVAVHEAEHPSSTALRRSEARWLGASLPLMALATGVAMVPTAGSGATSAWLEIVAALAAMTAGAIALPV